MRCTDPRTVGFKSDGKTIAWSQKDYSREFSLFQLPCGQCLNCRLEYARTWAIRCVHEAKMWPNNSFITLTYDDKHLGENKLDYRDFQLFMKKLRRRLPGQQIGYFVTGEYGEKSKRKHWHAIIFNYRPADCEYQFSNERGDKIFTSKSLAELWEFGSSNLGDVTFESAGYCARYAAKKLVHGHDQSHRWNPISKKSSKHAIGKKWLEKFHDDIFNYGSLVVDGKPVGEIPRYYIKWLQKHQPKKWERYVTQIKQIKAQKAIKQSLIDQASRPYSNSKNEAQRIITEKTIKNRLMKYLKL